MDTTQLTFDLSTLTDAFHRDCKPSFIPTNLRINNGKFIKLICDESYTILTSYLPDKHLLHCYLDASISENIQTIFHNIQFNSNSASHLIKLPQWGIGSIIKHVTKMIGKHYANNVSIIYGNLKWKYSDNKSCGNGWSCFFSPLDNGNLIKHNFKSITDHDQLLEYEEICGTNGKYNISNGKCECFDGNASNSYRVVRGECLLYPNDFNKSNIGMDYVTNMYDQPGEHTLDAHNCIVRSADLTYYETIYGPLYYSSQIVWFLLKDSPKRHILDTYANTMMIDDHIKWIAIHIRRGDSCNRIENELLRKCFTLKEYLHIANKMYSKYHNYDGEIYYIYISTDDDNVIKEIRKVQNSFENFKFRYQKELNREQFDPKYGYFDDNPNVLSVSIVEELLKDIWMMARCDFFIGDFTSAIARIAYELMLNNKKYYPPFHSMYTPWCDNTKLFIFQNKRYWC